MLVVSIFIDTPGNGYCNHHFMHHFEDVSKIKELNWCGVLLRSLAECKITWNYDLKKKFTGPILFLTVLYVDRVVFIYRNVPRAVPAFIGWNSDLLRNRETEELKAGNFGLGFLVRQTPGVEVPASSNVQSDLEPQVFESPAQEIRHTIWEIATKVSKLARLVRASAPGTLEGDTCKTSLAAAREMLSFNSAVGPVNGGDPLTQLDTLSQLSSTIWGNEDNLRAMDDIITAIQERNAMKDMPSFSVGLTPNDHCIYCFHP